MDNLGIFEKVASALDAGQNVALVTVTSTRGSTPGKLAYKMLVFAQGRQIAGTVGGGLVEAKMIQQAKNMLAEPTSRVFRFELDNPPDDDKGICGGSAELLIETFDETSQPLFRELAAALAGGDKGVLISTIAPGRRPEKVFLKSPFQKERRAAGLSSEVIEAANELLAEERASRKVSVGEQDVFIENIARPPRLILFGAGHLSYYICPYAKSLHFDVTVCDDRAQYANRERFPQADRVIVASFESAFDKIGIDRDSYIVIVTRGHKCDEIVLEQALKTEARYVGMIGSRRKTRTILERLADKGIPTRTLDRLYSPIGISIGALTPQEIALSIVCELVKISRLGPAPKIGHMKELLSQDPPGRAL